MCVSSGIARMSGFGDAGPDSLRTDKAVNLRFSSERMGTGDNLRRYSAHSSHTKQKTPWSSRYQQTPSLLEGRERHWIFALHIFDLLLYSLAELFRLAFPRLSL